MNQLIRLQLEIVVPPETIKQITDLIAKRQTPEQNRLEISRRAIYAGEDLPQQIVKC